MVDVFISYSRADQATVALIARAVEAEGYDVWWDAELPPHQSYGEVITEKIENARAAIVVWSATAVKSEWVRAEADMARHHRKLVQTAIDQVIPPLPFNQIQYAEIGDWRGEPDHLAWRKVMRSLAELCGQPAPEGPAPRPMPSPPPRAEVVAAPVRQSARWPLFAGIGVGAIGLAIAGGVLLGERGSAPPPAVTASAIPAPSPSPAAVPAAGAIPVAPAPRLPVPQVATAAEPAPAINPADLTFPDSSTRLLQPSEV